MKRETIRGTLLLVVLCLVPVYFWARSAPLDTRFLDLSTSLRSIAVVLALVGTCSFAFNLVLGARLSALDALFGGLDKMYGVHRVNGRVAFLLLLAHAVFILAGQAVISAESAIDLVLPANGWTIPLGVVALTLMAVSIGLTLYGHLDHEVFVYVQRTFGFIFLIGLVHVFRTPGAKALSRELTWYLAAVSLLGMAAFVYRSLFPDVLVKRYNYRVTGARPLDEAVMEITMSPQGDAINHRPGQFVFLMFLSGEMAKRFHPFARISQGQSEYITLRPGEVGKQFHPFSITSRAGDRDLKVAVKAVGNYTTAMRALEGGAWARVEGPYGGFSHLNAENRRQVWVAGGIGITPFLGMARSLDVSIFDVDLYWGVKHEREAHFVDELRTLDETHDRFRFTLFPEDERGFLTAEVVGRESHGLDGKDVFLCGPAQMLHALSSQFSALGVPRKLIHYEEFRFGS